MVSGEPEWGKGYIRDFFKEFLEHSTQGCHIAWGGKKHKVLPKLIDLDGLKRSSKKGEKGGVILAWLEGKSLVNSRNWASLLLVGDKEGKERPVLNYSSRYGGCLENRYLAAVLKNDSDGDSLGFWLLKSSYSIGLSSRFGIISLALQDP